MLIVNIISDVQNFYPQVSFKSYSSNISSLNSSSLIEITDNSLQNLMLLDKFFEGIATDETITKIGF